LFTPKNAVLALEFREHATFEVKVAPQGGILLVSSTTVGTQVRFQEFQVIRDGNEMGGGWTWERVLRASRQISGITINSWGYQFLVISSDFCN